MRLTINIEKRYAYAIIISLIALIGIIAVNAYNTGTNAVPSVFGHTPSEMNPGTFGRGMVGNSGSDGFDKPYIFLNPVQIAITKGLTLGGVERTNWYKPELCSNPPTADALKIYYVDSDGSTGQRTHHCNTYNVADWSSTSNGIVKVVNMGNHAFCFLTEAQYEIPADKAGNPKCRVLRDTSGNWWVLASTDTWNSASSSVHAHCAAYCVD